MATLKKSEKTKKAKIEALREKHVKDMRTLERLNAEMLIMAGYTAQEVSNMDLQQLKEKDMEELIRKKIPAAPDVCPNCGIVLNKEVLRTP
jgi:hypothetical protein